MSDPVGPYDMLDPRPTGEPIRPLGPSVRIPERTSRRPSAPSFEGWPSGALGVASETCSSTG